MSYVEEVLAESPVLMSPTQVSTVLNISRSSVYRLLEQGDLKAVKIRISTNTPSRSRITKESVKSLLNAWMKTDGDE